MLEPLIKGPAGLEYLRSAFENRYGTQTEAPLSLPLVVQWFSYVMLDSEQEWKDYLDSVSTLSCHGLSPSTLRAGGSIVKEVTNGCPTATVAGFDFADLLLHLPSISSLSPFLLNIVTFSMEDVILSLKSSYFVYLGAECKGEKVDLFLRLGLLRLVSEVEGLTVETLPETLKLNFFRLRDVQSQLQKIIVIISRWVSCSSHLSASFYLFLYKFLCTSCFRSKVALLQMVMYCRPYKPYQPFNLVSLLDFCFMA